MVKKWLTYGSNYCAVEHSINSDSKEVFYSLQLAQKKQEFSIHEQEKFLSEEALFKSLTDQKHLGLVINNNEVLSKKIEFVDENELKVVQKAFPSISITDFYFEVFVSSNFSFVSICRKLYVDKLVALYTKKGKSVLTISLGNLAIKSVAPFVSNENLKTTNATIDIVDNEIASISKGIDANEEYLINGLQLSNHYILSLGSIITYYTKQGNQIGFGNKIEKLNEDYIQKQIFTIGLKSGLGFLLFVLLLNFFFFNHYFSKVNILEEKLSLNETYKKQLLVLDAKIGRKEKIVQGLTSASQSKISWITDEIAQSIPNTILLNKLNYQPIKERIKKNKTILLKNKQLLMEGVSKKDSIFTRWTASLETKNWVDNLTILNYGKGKKSTSSFEILITMKDGE